jgi:hypothetical protein
MKKLLIVVVVLLAAAAGLAYWQGWFTVTKEDGKLQVKMNPEKFKKDREAFGNKVRAETKAVEERIASLRKKTEGLSADQKAEAEKKLHELEQEHKGLEKQIRDLDAAGEDQFSGIREGLSKSLAEVDRKIDDLTKKLDKARAK